MCDVLGSTAYIDGGILYCGGFNIHDPSGLAVTSCYSLQHPAPRWEKTFPLLKVRISAYQHSLPELYIPALRYYVF